MRNDIVEQTLLPLERARVAGLRATEGSFCCEADIFWDAAVEHLGEEHLIETALPEKLGSFPEFHRLEVDPLLDPSVESFRANHFPIHERGDRATENPFHPRHF